MVPLRLLVLADTPAQAAALLAYAQGATASLPALFILCPLPPGVDALPHPLALPAPDEAANQPAGGGPVRATWPAGLPFARALQHVLDHHRVTLLVLQHPFAGRQVPRRPLLTPTLQVLTAPPCAVLLQVPGVTPSRPQYVLAVGDGLPAALDWRADVARTLLAAWQPTLHAAVHGQGVRVFWPDRQPWRELVAGRPVASAVQAIPSAAHLADAVAARHADLIVLVLRAHGSLARRTTVLTALHSPVPVLLVLAAR